MERLLTKKEQLIPGQVKKLEKPDNLVGEHAKKNTNATGFIRKKVRECIPEKGGDVMNIISWILFGLIVGIVANAIDPSPNKGGIIGSILLGIVGSLVGGFLANLIFGLTITGFNVTAFLIAIAGSLLLLFFGKALKKV